MEKIGRNREHDKLAVTLLKKAGWKVLVVWECGLKPGLLEKTLQALLNRLR
jgi:DNA mismatch endonuclease (patch repair protein)